MWTGGGPRTRLEGSTPAAALSAAQSCLCTQSVWNDLEGDELIGLCIGGEVVVRRQHDGAVAIGQGLSLGDGLNVVELQTLVGDRHLQQ